MQLQELKSNLISDLNKEFLNTSAVLHGFLFGTSGATKTPAYGDPRYIPLYYHLSKYIQPKRILEVGFNIGLLSGAFLRGSKSVELLVGIYDPPLSRLGRTNIRLTYDGDIILTADWEIIKTNQWDLVIFNKELPYDECRKNLDLVWKHLTLDGVLMFERCGGEDNQAFKDFCQVHDRELTILKTRYGTGIVIR